MKERDAKFVREQAAQDKARVEAERLVAREEQQRKAMEATEALKARKEEVMLLFRRKSQVSKMGG